MADEPGDKPDNNQPDNNQPEPAKPDFKAPQSQEEFDRMVGQRLERERAKYADYEDLKKKAAEHDKALEAQKSDHEKAVEAARKDGESAATAAANARIVKSDARAAAATMKFRNPAAAVRLLDLADVKVGNDGEPDADAIKAKLTALAESDPYLLEIEEKPKPAKKATALKSGAASGDEPGAGKAGAAAALRALRGAGN